ncbi:hypothetical protein A3850_006075 [Lewinella sp. 4G2]|nr:hypothetical protein A3850_006075 [Lewinella sp. 4G2]
MIRPVTIVADHFWWAPAGRGWAKFARPHCLFTTLLVALFSLPTHLAGSPVEIIGIHPASTILVAVLDSTPPAPKREPDEAFPASSQAEKARAAVIVEHTRLGLVPPDSDEARRRREDKQRAAEAKKAEEAAALADRLERRRQRLAELAAERGDLTKGNKRKLLKEARAARKRELARAKAEREQTKLLAQRAEEQRIREEKRAAFLAKREAEAARLAKQREADAARALAKREAEEKRARAAAAMRAATPARPVPIARPPAPRLTAAERKALAQQAKENARLERITRARLQKESKAARRAARIVYAAGRKDRQAANRKARRDALVARNQAREERRQARRLAATEREASKLAKRAARDARNADRLAAKAAKRTEREAIKAARLAAKAAKRAGKEEARLARLTAQRLRKEGKLAQRLARRQAANDRRAARLAAREARRSERLARRALRKADRLARREARRAARLARREARRLRRKENPIYWTAEPAIALGLPLRSGGGNDEKSLEAITVQALAGYHRARGMSIRGGLAATVINSKVSSESTRTETTTEMAVIQIIQNPDGSRTEVTGPVQVTQTITSKTRYYNRLTSIDLPVLVGYRLQGNRYGLMIEAGPCLNLTSGGEAHVKTGDAWQQVGGGYYIGRRSGIGVLAQVTGEYQLSSNSALTAGVRLQSFGAAFEDREVTSNTTRASTISLSVGYRFKF